MKCDEIREILSSYADGEARGEERRLAEEHLASCAACRDLVRRMKVVGAGVGRIEAVVPRNIRDAVFARMEREGLLPRRRRLGAFPIRWAAIPLAAAAALALFVLMPRETGKVGPAVSTRPPTAASERAAQTPQAPERLAGRAGEAGPAKGTEEATRGARQAPEAVSPSAGAAATGGGASAALTPEDRDIVAHLEVLEDPAAFEEPSEVDELEIVEPAAGSKG